MNWEAVTRYLSFRREHYHRTFDTPQGKAVLRDLAKFCRANSSTWDDNERKAAALSGRRDVWLHIQEHLQLTAEQLAELYASPQEGNQT